MKIARGAAPNLGSILVLVALAVGCTAVQPGAVHRGDRDDGSKASAPKRLTAAIMGDPTTLSAKLNTSGPGSNVPGVDALEDLVHPGMANLDNRGLLNPV